MQMSVGHKLSHLATRAIDDPMSLWETLHGKMTKGVLYCSDEIENSTFVILVAPSVDYLMVQVSRINKEED